MPAQQQQEYFGGETLRLIAEHPILSNQKIYKTHRFEKRKHLTKCFSFTYALINRKLRI
jgi:hypothetical protein